MAAKVKPNSRFGWYEYYAAKFNKTFDPACAHLACWYLFLHLAFDEDSN